MTRCLQSFLSRGCCRRELCRPRIIARTRPLPAAETRQQCLHQARKLPIASVYTWRPLGCHDSSVGQLSRTNPSAKRKGYGIAGYACVRKSLNQVGMKTALRSAYKMFSYGHTVSR